MATRVTIKKDLEARLRAGNPEKAQELLGEIIKLLDDEKRETGSSKRGDKPGLGYKELVSLFRFYLGPDLVLPPNPNTTWIIRMVNSAKQLGVSENNVEQIVRGLRKQYPRGPYQFEFVLRRADIHFAAGEDRGDSGSTEEGKVGKTATVYTGRRDLPD